MQHQVTSSLTEMLLYIFQQLPFWLLNSSFMPAHDLGSGITGMLGVIGE
jgi:hypothetical protein